MVAFVATTGPGSMKIYARRLSERLNVHRVYSDTYQHIRDRFSISWFSRETLRAVLDDRNFIKLLNKSSGMIHFPSQHLGRYGDFVMRLFTMRLSMTLSGEAL